MERFRLDIRGNTCHRNEREPLRDAVSRTRRWQMTGRDRKVSLCIGDPLDNILLSGN